ncbi:MAG: hypothetical protein ACR2OW_08000 [Methyloligellaceae bacterium]
MVRRHGQWRTLSRGFLNLALVTVLLAVFGVSFAPALQSRGSCDFTLRLSAGLFCTTEWQNFKGWLACMKDGMESLDFKFNDDYVLTTVPQTGERILVCKKTVECAFQLPAALKKCRRGTFGSTAAWRACVEGEIANRDVGLVAGEHYGLDDEQTYMCRNAK